jgi:hypothetical protein
MRVLGVFTLCFWRFLPGFSDLQHPRQRKGLTVGFAKFTASVFLSTGAHKT